MARQYIPCIKKKKPPTVKAVGRALEKKSKPVVYEIKIPEGVSVSIEDGLVKVKGDKGEVSRRFRTDVLSIEHKNDTIYVSTQTKRKREKAIAGTVKAHIQNMIHGVTDGVTYKMKIIYSHFPMNVKVQGNTLVIDNFLGEKHPRKARILKDVTVDIKGQDITLRGYDVEAVSQTAANIEQATKISERDLRVFQDGIYITEKDGKPV